jgi:polypeptide N-acetylgalactosaminyltransferase
VITNVILYYIIFFFVFSIGEHGNGVTVDKDKLAPEERKKYDDGWQNNAFNQYVSDQISLHRSLKDVRDDE